jgi:FkbM family methyltransferase
MTVGSLSNYFFLFKTFRNWLVLIQNLRHGGYLNGGPLREELVFWDGRTVVHPPNRRGLAAVLLEIWHNNIYRLGNFYSPRAGDVVADVGAHVGLFSLRILREAPRCRVVAIEPSGENFECLRQNVSDFLHAGRIEIHNVAIGPDFGKSTMLDIPSNRSFDARTTPALAGDVTAIDMVPLSRVLELARTDELALLKMDAEGGEEGAFAMAEPKVMQRIQRIAMEYHDHLVPGTLAMLRQRISQTHTLTVFPDACGVHGHLFAVRKDLATHDRPCHRSRLSLAGANTD